MRRGNRHDHTKSSFVYLTYLTKNQLWKVAAVVYKHMHYNFLSFLKTREMYTKKVVWKKAITKLIRRLFFKSAKWKVKLFGKGKSFSIINQILSCSHVNSVSLGKVFVFHRIDSFHNWLKNYFTWNIFYNGKIKQMFISTFSYRMVSFLFHTDILFSNWSPLSLPWDRIDLS